LAEIFFKNAYDIQPAAKIQCRQFQPKHLKFTKVISKEKGICMVGSLH